MISKKNQDSQVKPSKKYIDDFSTESNLQGGSSSLEDDLNAIRTQIRKISGRDNWYDNLNVPSRTDLEFQFGRSSRTWSIIIADDEDTTVPDRRQDTLNIVGGYGIETEVVGKDLFLKPTADYYTVYRDESDSTSPTQIDDILEIVGASSNITITAEEVSGQKRIVFDYTGPGKQDLWYRIFDDDGSVIFPTDPDTNLEIVGENSISASISGDVLTVSYPQDLATTASPTFADIQITGLDPNGVVFVGEDNYLSTDPSSLYWDYVNKRLGVGGQNPEEELSIFDGSLSHKNRSRPSAISYTEYSYSYRLVRNIKYYKGFVFFTTENKLLISVNVSSDEQYPFESDRISINDTEDDTSTRGFDISGKYLYVCSGTSLHVVDIEDPYNMQIVGSIALSDNHLQTCKIYGNSIIAIESDLGSEEEPRIYIVDITNPVSPTLTYEDTTMPSYYKVQKMFIHGNRIVIPSQDRQGCFSLTNIEEEGSGFYSRLISENTETIGDGGPNGISVSGNTALMSHLDNKVIFFDINNDISSFGPLDIGDTGEEYHSVVSFDKDSFYLLKGDKIVTVKVNDYTSIESADEFSHPYGYSPLCADFANGRLYVSFSEGSYGGEISIMKMSSEDIFSIRTERSIVGRLSSFDMTVTGDAVIKDSLNIGPGGLFVDPGQGISVDGDTVAHGKVGIGTGNPLEDLHIAGGKFYHRPNVSEIETNDAVAYEAISLSSENNSLYVLSEDGSIYAYNVSSNDELNLENKIDIEDSEFVSNIVITGNTIFYAKNSHTLGVTRKNIKEETGDDGDSSEIDLGENTSISQIIVSGKYAYISSNGTEGSSIYIVDVSDIGELSILGTWRIGVQQNPTLGITVDYIHKNGDLLFVYGHYAIKPYLFYALDVSDPSDIVSVSASSSTTGPTVNCGYSVGGQEVFLSFSGTGRKISRIKYGVSSYEISSTTNISLSSERDVAHSMKVVGNSIYSCSHNGLSIYDIQKAVSGEDYSPFAVIEDFGVLDKTNNIEIIGENLFVINLNGTLGFMNLRTFTGIVTISGSIRSDSVRSTMPVVSQDYHSDEMNIVGNMLVRDKMGVSSHSDISVYGTLSVNTEHSYGYGYFSGEEFPDYNVLVSGKNVDHKSLDLYNEISTIIPGLGSNVADSVIHNGFIYQIYSDEDQSNILRAIAIDSSSGYYIAGEIEIVESGEAVTQCFCFQGEYCYIFMSNRKMYIVDISVPSDYMPIVSNSFVFPQTKIPIVCAAKGKNLYVTTTVNSNSLYTIDISDVENPSISSIEDISFLGTSINFLESRLYCSLASSGEFKEFDISTGIPVLMEDSSYGVSNTVSIKTYGQFLFLLYSESGTAHILKMSRNTGVSSTIDIPSISDPKDFEVFENGFIILTETDLYITNTSGDIFSGSEILVYNSVALPNGSSDLNNFISLYGSKLYLYTAINSKITGYQIGEFNSVSIKTESLSAFNANVENIDSSGKINSNAINIGSGGLNVSSDHGISVDENISVLGNTGINDIEPSERLSIKDGSASHMKKNIDFSSQFFFPLDGDMTGVEYNGEYIYVFTSVETIEVWKKNDDQDFENISTNSEIMTSEYRDSFIYGDYLYVVNGSEENSILQIFGISDPEKTVYINSISYGHDDISNYILYDMSKIVVSGDYAFVISKHTNDKINIIDISDKENINLLKTIELSFSGISDIECNGKYLAVVSESRILTIRMDSIFDQNPVIGEKTSSYGFGYSYGYGYGQDYGYGYGTGLDYYTVFQYEENSVSISENILVNPVVCKFVDNVLFVLSNDPSNSMIDLFDSTGLSGTYPYNDTLNLIKQINVGENVNDFTLNSNELIVVSDTNIRSYKILSDYETVMVVEEVTESDSISRLHVSNGNIFARRDVGLGSDRIFCINHGRFENMSVSASSSKIYNSIIENSVFSTGNISIQGNLNVGDFGIVSHGDMNIKNDITIFGNLSIGTSNQDTGIMLKDKSFVVEPKKTPSYSGQYDIRYIGDVVASNNFYSPIGYGIGEDSGSITANQKMDGPKKCKACGNFLYVVGNTMGFSASNHGSISVIDISNKNAPIFLYSFQHPDIESCIDFDIMGNYAYVCTDTSISVIDISVVGSFEIVNTINITTFDEDDFPFETSDTTVIGAIFGLAVSGNYMFVACSGFNYLCVFDIEDKDDIRLVSAANIESSVNANVINIVNDKVYITVYDGAVSIQEFSIRNITRNPKIVKEIEYDSFDEISTPNAIAVNDKFVYVFDEVTELLYVNIIEHGEIIEKYSIDIDISGSVKKIISKDNFVYIMSDSMFLAYKQTGETIEKWLEYDGSQNDIGVGTWTDFDIQGSSLYILDSLYHRVLNLDMYGMTTDFASIGSYESYYTKVNKKICGYGDMRVNGNVSVGNSLYSTGLISTGILQSKQLIQKDFESNYTLGMSGSIDVGESKFPISENKIFYIETMPENTGNIKSAIIDKNIMFVQKGNRLYTVDISSEEPNYISPVSDNVGLLNIGSFFVQNNSLYLFVYIPHDTEWRFKHYSFENPIEDLSNIDDLVYQKAGISTNSDGVIKMIGVGEIIFFVILNSELPEEGQQNITYGYYHTISKKFAATNFVINIPSEDIVSDDIYLWEKDRKIFVSIRNGKIYSIDISSISEFETVSPSLILDLGEEIISGIEIYGSSLFVTTEENETDGGKVLSYRISHTDSEISLTENEEIQFSADGASGSLIGCPNPSSIAIVGSSIYISTAASELGDDIGADNEAGLCVFRISNDHDLGFLFKKESFSEEGEISKVISCNEFLLINIVSDGEEDLCYMYKPTNAKVFGSRIQTISAESIVSDGAIEVNGMAHVGNMEAFSNIFCRGEMSSSWGISGQLFGYRKLNSSISVPKDDTFSFFSETGISIDSVESGSSNGLYWNNDEGFIVKKSGVYEIKVGTSISYSFTGNQTLTVSFYKGDISTIIKSYDYIIYDLDGYQTFISSYSMEVELGNGESSAPIGVIISVATDVGGIGQPLEYTVSKGSFVSVKKIS